ncbi:uncharacterized protein K460DRAFT_355008 [Cucurbitaria berberidis CBS 394.84]|uniref:Uncharacterized protein n=1 Tax=Cucurbitaria berberidis CBS 394.84 TaxID=1168544 RepID=A0A9P4GGR8_9PLEO|nr:uncharacterized protein K460DRAFT_355008 [Cucurbitaria berberidis CBS 394.84]KAF1845159.1 hypothetical protein K460DRAFT_355008 [Cucurbitaria berberidis CBS 394.84]
MCRRYAPVYSNASKASLGKPNSLGARQLAPLSAFKEGRTSRGVEIVAFGWMALGGLMDRELQNEAYFYLNPSWANFQEFLNHDNPARACSSRQKKTRTRATEGVFIKPAIFSQPPKDGKQGYRPLKKPSAPFDAVTKAKYKHYKVTAWLLGPNDEKTAFIFYKQSNLNFTKTKANCNKIMDLIANFANAWPDAPLDDDLFKWQVVAAAVVVLSPGSVRIKVPGWTQDGWRIRIPYYDTDTCTIRNFERTCYAGVSLETSFPDVPSSAELWQSGPSSKEIIIPKDLNGRTATKKVMEMAATSYEELYLAVKRHGGRHSSAHRLIKVWYHSWKKASSKKSNNTVVIVI